VEGIGGVRRPALVEGPFEFLQIACQFREMAGRDGASARAAGKGSADRGGRVEGLVPRAASSLNDPSATR